MATKATNQVQNLLNQAGRAVAAGNPEEGARLAEAAQASLKNASAATRQAVANIVNTYNDAANTSRPMHGVGEPDPGGVYNAPPNYDSGGSGGGGGGGVGSTGGGGYSAPPPPPPVPVNPWITTSTYVAPSGVKQASPDIIVFDDTTIDPEYLIQSFFDQFSATELISISRSDLINGDAVSYSPITNLSRLQEQFNPNNIIAIGSYQNYLTGFNIDLVKRGMNDPYFNENVDLVISVDLVKSDESIEVEILSGGTINRIEL